MNIVTKADGSLLKVGTSLATSTACCCGPICPVCSCYPSSIVISVSDYDSFPAPYNLTTWSAFSSIAYKCCFTDSVTGKPYVMYKMNPHISGISPISASDYTYLILYVLIFPASAVDGCFIRIVCTKGVYSFFDLDTFSFPCLVPRDPYTALTACDGLGQNEDCSPSALPFSNGNNSWFVLTSSAGCPVCTSGGSTDGLDFTDVSGNGTGGVIASITSCSIPSTVFTIEPNSSGYGAGSFTVTLT